MHCCVNEAVNDDESAGDFVKVDVLVQRQQHCQPELTKLRYAVAKHDHQDKHRSEIQTLAFFALNETFSRSIFYGLSCDFFTTCSGKDDPPISRPVIVLESVILDNPADDEAQVDLFQVDRGDKLNNHG